jgi:nucleoside-diphosphate-sugar epimerase
MSSRKINDMGWHPKISLKQGINAAYQWFLDNKARYL